MTKIIKVMITSFVVSAFFLGCRGSSEDALLQYINMQDLLKPSQINPEDYEDAFFDDFNGKDLDYSKWSKCDNEERQAHLSNHGWWMKECAYVENGNLVLECKKAEDGRLFSGGIRSRGKFERTKGIYEIRFKVEGGSGGFWYAFWIFAQNNDAHAKDGTAKDGAELDCFEILPYKNALKSTVHWDAYGDNHKQKETSDYRFNSYDTWHIFQFVWDDDSYKCYLDDKYLWTMSGSEFGNGMCQVPGYMKVTTEFGEGFGGTLDSIFSRGGTKKMYVDYVKVMKLK